MFAHSGAIAIEANGTPNHRRMTRSLDEAPSAGQRTARGFSLASLARDGYQLQLGELTFLLAQTTGKILWRVARSLRWVRSRGLSMVSAGVAPALAPTRPPHLSPHRQGVSQELASERSLPPGGVDS